MSDLIISRVEEWYAENGRRFSKLFDVFTFRLMRVMDDKHGKATIEIDGSSVGANVTFWNKGDVTVLLLNKITNKEHKLDDRRLVPADQIESLLDSYMRRIVEESKGKVTKS
jgi:hypothetical protein